MHPLGKGISVAAAVATLVLAGNVAAMAQDKGTMEPVKCAGLNECKGKGSCKSAQNECKGKNACKGQSFVETKTAQECNQRGGQVVKK